MPTVSAVSLRGEVDWTSDAEVRGTLLPSRDSISYLLYNSAPNADPERARWTLASSELRLLVSVRDETGGSNPGPTLRSSGARWQNESAAFTASAVALRLNPAPGLGSVAVVWGEPGQAQFSSLDTAPGVYRVRSVASGSVVSIPGSSDPGLASQESPYRATIPGHLLEVKGSTPLLASGPLRAALFGWTITVTDSEGTVHTYTTGVTALRDPATGLARGHRVAYALIEADAASFRLDPESSYRLFTPALGFRGTTVFPHGSYAGDHEDVARDHASAFELRMPGSLWLGVDADDSRDNHALVWGEADWAAASMVLLGGATASPLIVAAGAAGLLVGARYLPRFGRWLSAGLAAPLFARLRQQRLQDNPTRHRIFDLIHHEPGLTLSDIVTKMDIGWGTAAYHTQILLRQGKIQDLRFLNRVCFFDGAESGSDRLLQTVLLRQRNYEGVMRIVSQTPGASQRDIAQRSGHARQYISRLVGKMERAGLLRAEPGPSGRRYFPTGSSPLGPDTNGAGPSNGASGPPAGGPGGSLAGVSMDSNSLA